MFVPLDNSFLDVDDTLLLERLFQPEWSRHLEDMLKSLLLPDPYTKQEIFKRLEQNNGTWEVETMISRNSITIQQQESQEDGGDSGSSLVFHGRNPIQDPLQIGAVDGVMYLLDNASLPPSVSHSIYDVLHSTGELDDLLYYLSTVTNTTTNNASAVVLDSLEKSVPVVFFWPPNPIWDYIPKDNWMDVIGNHLFEGLWFEDDLQRMDGELVTSVNGKEWVISVLGSDIFLSQGAHDAGVDAPAILVLKGPDSTDILARNGVMHKIEGPALLDSSVADSATLFQDCNGCFVTSAPTSQPTQAPVSCRNSEDCSDWFMSVEHFCGDDNFCHPMTCSNLMMHYGLGKYTFASNNNPGLEGLVCENYSGSKNHGVMYGCANWGPGYDRYRDDCDSYYQLSTGFDKGPFVRAPFDQKCTAVSSDGNQMFQCYHNANVKNFNTFLEQVDQAKADGVTCCGGSRPKFFYHQRSLREGFKKNTVTTTNWGIPEARQGGVWNETRGLLAFYTIFSPYEEPTPEPTPQPTPMPWDYTGPEGVAVSISSAAIRHILKFTILISSIFTTAYAIY